MAWHFPLFFPWWPNVNAAKQRQKNTTDHATFCTQIYEFINYQKLQLFMCENRCEKTTWNSHNVHLHFCIILFPWHQHFGTAIEIKIRQRHFCASCQDCFFLRSQNESLVTSCPDIIFILWALPFACCIFSERKHFCSASDSWSYVRTQKLIVVMIFMGK